MFTQHTPRTGNPVGKSHSVFIRVGASIGAIAITSGFVLAAAPAASAETPPASWAEAQFLSGSVLGTDLSVIAELKPAVASNNGAQAVQSQDDPLEAEVLSTIPITLPNGLQLSLGDSVDAGAVGQYAQADKTGSSLAATGAVGNDGGIGVGQTDRGAAGDLNLQLNSAVNSAFAGVLTDLELSMDGISSQAVASLDQASGAYTISDATLSFTSPALADLSGKVATALDGVDKDLIAIGSDDGELGNAVDKVLDPVLGPIGSSANVTVNIDSDLQGAVQSLLESKYGNGAVSFDLETGKVYVDLETLLGGDLNSLAPNTEILSGPVVNKVLEGITDTVSTLSDNIVDKVRTALHDATVTVHADLDLLTAQDGGSNTVCNDLPVVGDVLGTVLGGDTGIGGGLGGGLGGLLGRSLPTNTLAKPTLCEAVQNILPDLHSTVNLDIVGTVDDLIDGTATTANLTVSLLDGTIPVSLNAAAIIPSLGDGLQDGLFGTDGSVQGLADSLNSGLVNPAVDGLLGNGDSVSTILNDVLSVQANVQELTPMDSGTVFSQTAVRIAVLPDGGASGARVNLARSSVGPNATVIVPPVCTDGSCTPCTTNCGPGGNPDPCFSNCSAGAASLAFTGVGIATVIAIILALLAAGAYLAREGYRRNHPKSLTSD